jgi:hypothetical protein
MESSSNSSAQQNNECLAPYATMNNSNVYNSSAPLPTYNFKQILTNVSHADADEVKLVSPKLKLHSLLAEYAATINEINRLIVSSGATLNTSDANKQQKFTKNLNKDLNKNLSKNNSSDSSSQKDASLVAVVAVSEATNKKVNQENAQLDSELTGLLKQRDTLKSIICIYLNESYKIRMLDSQTGLPFLQSKNDIPLNCFISSEAVWWCIANIDEIDNESEAIQLIQIMCDFDLIRHINIHQKIFIHGFYLYYIVTDENEMSSHLYTKDYLEVGFCDIDKMPLKSASLINLPVTWNEMLTAYQRIFADFSRTEFSNNTKKVHSNNNINNNNTANNSNTNNHRNNNNNCNNNAMNGTSSVSDSSKINPSEEFMRYVNVDVDVNRRSNRVEWASAVYRPYYHPLCAFELEIQWEMATGSLLSELLFSYSKLSNRFNFHLVPAPIDPFAVPIVANSDPLRRSLYIKLNLTCLIQQEEKSLFESFIDDRYKFAIDASESDAKSLEENFGEFFYFLLNKMLSRDLIEKRIRDDAEFFKQELHEFIETERINYLQFFQEAILEKFGFVRNAAIVKTLDLKDPKDEDPVHFIHSTGGMFVQIPNYSSSYLSFRSRHTSANTQQQSSSNNEASATNKTSFQNPIKLDTINENQNHMMTRISSAAATATNTSSNSSDKITSLDTPTNSLNQTITHSLQKRERSSSKSQQLEFLRLNPKAYLSDNISTSSSIDSSNNESTLNSLLNDASSRLSDISAMHAQNVKGNNDGTTTSSAITTEITNDKKDTCSINLAKEKLTTNEQEHIHLTPHASEAAAAGSSFRSKPFYIESEGFIGFLWSWNFMLGKKWRSQFTGDETFQDNMLADFRLFCSNQDGRLQAFFNETKKFFKK